MMLMVGHRNYHNFRVEFCRAANGITLSAL